MNSQYDAYMCRPVKTGEFRLNRWSKTGPTISCGINGNCCSLDELKVLLAKNKQILVCKNCVRAIQAEYEHLRADDANKLTQVTGVTKTEVSSTGDGSGFFVLLVLSMLAILIFTF